MIIANAIGKVRNQYTLSADGHENQFAISHLAHFVLVNSLLPLVYAARSDDPSFPPRIIIVSSIAQAFGPVHLEDPNFDNGKEYDVVKGYAQAKTANVLFSKELAKRLAGKGVLSFSFHPGSGYYISSSQRPSTFTEATPPYKVSPHLALKLFQMKRR